MAFTHKPKPANERFLEKVSVDKSGCWPWTGYIDQKGYGVFGVSSREIYKAHRYSYWLHVGDVPKGKQLDHLCRVRHCVNPSHLEPVTNRENVIRGNAARPKQAACKKGHAFTDTNTYVYPKRGTRHCKECQRKRSAARQK